MTLPNITATGRLGADPELKFTAAGKAVASFRIACTERINDNGEWKDGATVWLPVSLWEKEAESATEHLRKGDEVTIVGQLTVRQYEHNGQSRESWEFKWPKVSKSLPKIAQSQQRSAQPAPPAANGWAQQQPPNDPWSTGPASNEQPPF